MSPQMARNTTAAITRRRTRTAASCHQSRASRSTAVTISCMKSIVVTVAATAVLVAVSIAIHGQAPAPDPEDVAAGMRIYRQKADCQACHGWAADGRKMDSQMPDGANLRATKLDRAKLIQAIKCGI